MSSSELIRWGGMAALVGSVLLIIGDLLTLVAVDLNVAENPEVATTASYTLLFVLWLLAGVLLLLGLVGLYSSQSVEVGTLGLVNFLVAFLGTAMALVGTSWAQLFIGPFLAVEAPEVFRRVPLQGSCFRSFWQL